MRLMCLGGRNTTRTWFVLSEVSLVSGLFCNLTFQQFNFGDSYVYFRYYDRSFGW